MFPGTMQDAPDLGAYTAQHATESDDELFAELDAEVEALNGADADDVSALMGGSGRDASGDLASAFHEFRAQRLADIDAAYVRELTQCGGKAGCGYCVGAGQVP